MDFYRVEDKVKNSDLWPLLLYICDHCYCIFVTIVTVYLWPLFLYICDHCYCIFVTIVTVYLWPMLLYICDHCYCIFVTIVTVYLWPLLLYICDHCYCIFVTIVSLYLKFFTFLKNLLYLLVCYDFLWIVVKTHELFCLFCVYVWINIFISCDLDIYSGCLIEQQKIHNATTTLIFVWQIVFWQYFIYWLQ